MTLRLVERYISYQGEGPNTGVPTMFVRFAGCNLKCAGWACDTPQAIDPKIFSKTQRTVTPDELYTSIMADAYVENICFTGGEPFLQNHEDLLSLWRMLSDMRRTIEVFTNGTILWPQGAEIVDNFVMDWKLPGSEEFPDESILRQNLGTLAQHDAVKFTVKDREDFDRALLNYRTVIQAMEPTSRPQVWCGPVWGAITPDKLSRWMKNEELDWRLNIQAHKYIFGADTVGV